MPPKSPKTPQIAKLTSVTKAGKGARTISLSFPFRNIAPPRFWGFDAPKIAKKPANRKTFLCNQSSRGRGTISLSFPFRNIAPPRFWRLDAPKIARASQKPRLCSRTKKPELPQIPRCKQSRTPTNPRKLPLFTCKMSANRQIPRCKQSRTPTNPHPRPCSPTKACNCGSSAVLEMQVQRITHRT